MSLWDEREVKLKFSEKMAVVFSKNYTNRFKKSLGPKAESLIAQDEEKEREIQQKIREEESRIKDFEKYSTESEKQLQKVKNLQAKYERLKAEREKLEKEHGTTIDVDTEVLELKMLEKEEKN